MNDDNDRSCLMGCFEKRPIAAMLSLAVLFVLVLLLLCGGSMSGITAWLGRLGDFLGLIDDVLLRILGTILIVIAGIQFVTTEFRGACCGDKNTSDNDGEDATKSRSFKLLQVAVLIGTGGISFFAGDQLDKSDPSNQTIAPLSSSSPPRVLAQWTQIVAKEKGCVLKPGDQAAESYAACGYDFLVRVVIPAEQSCPTARVFLAGLTVDVALQKRANPYANFASINVCETRIDGKSEAKQVVVVKEQPISLSEHWNNEKAANKKKAGPATVSIIGDTGCRANREQTCDEKSWPFANIVSMMLSSEPKDVPQLVMHVGDFMYIKFDAWDTWKAEFFDPAQPLLNAAPWIVMRGNHERCGEHGDAPLGYYLFFDTGDTTTLKCANDNELTASYAIDLPGNPRIIVTDSSIAFAKRKSNPANESGYTQMRAMMEQVKALAKDVERGVQFATHIPVYVIEKCDPKFSPECVSNEGSDMMRAAWFEADMPNANIETIISGHQHLIQFATPTNQDKTTVQIVSGAGGVNLDEVTHKGASNPACLSPDDIATHGETEIFPTYQRANTVDVKFCSNEQFGYVWAENDGFTFKPVTP